jgi:DNA-binding XRE family transcriptional regulator
LTLFDYTSYPIIDQTDYGQRVKEVNIMNQEEVNILTVRRMAAKLTMSQLAAAAGLTRMTIFNIENSRSNASEESVFALAEALKCEPIELLPLLRQVSSSLRTKKRNKAA